MSLTMGSQELSALLLSVHDEEGSCPRLPSAGSGTYFALRSWLIQRGDISASASRPLRLGTRTVVTSVLLLNLVRAASRTSESF